MKLYPLVAAALTPREIEVAALLMRGMTSAEMAVALGICASTVKTKLEHLARKFDIPRDRHQHILLAMELYKYSEH